jgi:hypothetical protein
MRLGDKGAGKLLFMKKKYGFFTGNTVVSLPVSQYK